MEVGNNDQKNRACDDHTLFESQFEFHCFFDVLIGKMNRIMMMKNMRIRSSVNFNYICVDVDDLDDEDEEHFLKAGHGVFFHNGNLFTLRLQRSAELKAEGEATSDCNKRLGCHRKCRVYYIRPFQR